MVMIGTSWTELTEGDYWSDAYSGATIYWRVWGKATPNASAKTARVDFEWEVRFSGYYAYNYDSHHYTITCTDNGGSGHSATSDWAFGEVTSDWSTPSGASGGDNYWSGVKYKSDGTASFTATFSGTRWNGNSFSWSTNVQLPPIAVNYTVSYNANGGTGAPSSQTKVHGTTLTLSSTIPTLTGHTFSSWNTIQNGTGTTYQPGGSYTVNANVTLYAQWDTVTYAINYNANGGTGAPEPSTKTHGQTLFLPATTPERAGYTFFRWNTLANGTGQEYSPGGPFNVNTTTTLYAIWIQNSIPTDMIHDCYIKVNDNWIPCFAYLNINNVWYFIKKTAVNVNNTWKNLSNKI